MSDRIKLDPPRAGKATQATVDTLNRVRHDRELTGEEIDWLRAAATVDLDGEVQPVDVLVGAGVDAAEEIDLAFPPDERLEYLPDVVAVLAWAGHGLTDAVAYGVEQAEGSDDHLAALSIPTSMGGIEDGEERLEQLVRDGSNRAAVALLQRRLREGRAGAEVMDEIVDLAGESAVPELVDAWAVEVARDAWHPEFGLEILMGDPGVPDRWRAQAALAGTFRPTLRHEALRAAAQQVPTSAVERCPDLLDHRPQAPEWLRPSDRLWMRSATHRAPMPWRHAAPPSPWRADLDATRALFDREHERRIEEDETYVEAKRSYFFWMSEDEDVAFDEQGEMVAPLTVHWGVDRKRAAASLRDGLADRFELVLSDDAQAPFEVRPVGVSEKTIVEALRALDHGDPAGEEGVEYLEATVCRPEVRDGQKGVTYQRERLLFDLWRSVSGADLPGDVRFLDVGEARRLIREVYTKPGGAAVPWKNGWPYMPFAREADGVMLWIDNRHSPAPVVRGAADADKEVVAPSLRTWFADVLGLVADGAD